MSGGADWPVVAEVVRSGFVESRHHGVVVATAADGGVDWAVGDHDRGVLPRSCHKPLQAVAMVRLGLRLAPDLLALVCASHSGEPMHLDGVRRILAGAGLDVDALQTPPDHPLDDVERDASLRAGRTPDRLVMNCSGKHAGMLATCVLRGWDVATYRDPAHPLQVAIRETTEELTAARVRTVAVDGCGAPQLSTTLFGLARAFGRLAAADSAASPAEAEVAEAIRTHPEMVSGSRRDERALLTAIPGAIAKAGAEACYAVGLADGRAFALKVDDGSPRARPVVMAAALVRSGVDREPGVDGDAVRATGAAPVLGAGEPVGEVRAVLV